MFVSRLLVGSAVQVGGGEHDAGGTQPCRLQKVWANGRGGRGGRAKSRLSRRTSDRQAGSEAAPNAAGRIPGIGRRHAQSARARLAPVQLQGIQGSQLRTDRHDYVPSAQNWRQASAKSTRAGANSVCRLIAAGSVSLGKKPDHCRSGLWHRRILGVDLVDAGKCDRIASMLNVSNTP